MNFLKVNTDVEQEAPSVLGNRSVPFRLFIPMEGQPIVAAGALPKTQLKKIINDQLSAKKAITLS